MKQVRIGRPIWDWLVLALAAAVGGALLALYIVFAMQLPEM